MFRRGSFNPADVAALAGRLMSVLDSAFDSEIARLAPGLASGRSGSLRPNSLGRGTRKARWHLRIRR
jgi:hypothetical protein